MRSEFSVTKFCFPSEVFDQEIWQETLVEGLILVADPLRTRQRALQASLKKRLLAAWVKLFLAWFCWIWFDRSVEAGAAEEEEEEEEGGISCSCGDNGVCQCTADVLQIVKTNIDWCISVSSDEDSPSFTD